MEEVLEKLERDFEQLERQLSNPEVLANMDQYRELAQRHAGLQEKVEQARAYRALQQEVTDLEELLKDPSTEDDFRELAATELEQAREKARAAREKLLLLLLPKDPATERNAIVEIRAGTGGEEAALFAGDLFRMYTRLAERRGWQWELISANETGIGGYKEVIFGVSAPGAYGVLQHESGVHRVQRVPKTESSGRIHTSAATVAILPEAEEVDVEIRPDDLEWSTMRAAGAGGQHMQKNETAVRVVHKPTGLVVSCQDERSQHQNREKALRVLRSRILEMERERQESEIAKTRKAQVKSGDRSDKIRTYNFPQDRVTDHRINLTLHNLPAILDGELDELLEALELHYQQERLAAGE